MTIAVHLITGFLGAGKTSLITALIAKRPAGERWAVLVNEFGRIGIDQAAWAGSDVLVKAVPGGCMCCAQNLPMQITLGQISSEPGIARLLIEPSGLGHPVQIRETLTAPHWQHYFSLGASLCAVDGRQLADEKIRTHETFLAQVAIADALILTKQDVLSAEEQAQARSFAESQVPAKPFFSVGQADGELIDIDLACLQVPVLKPAQQRRSLLHRQPTASTEAAPAIDPPYHYHQKALDHEVGGWVFPADWQFDHDLLMSLLLAWQTQLVSRIKGVLHTNQGWLFFNIEAGTFAVRQSEYRADSRLELIAPQARDWAQNEQQLLATMLTPAQAGEQGE
ncbi:MAG: GTP-binding protein [Moraxellaceae bacterium]|nr:GTP-binding protein [Moraxellaceae bacterium]